MLKQLCIVIPCYNEEYRLPVSKFEHFLKEQSSVQLCFVDDGSKDITLNVLNTLRNSFKDQVHIVSYADNVGKAEAIRRAVTYCGANLDFDHIAYLDADLSTSLEECADMSGFLEQGYSFVFGSRIMKIGSTIVRRQHRFLIGRFIATIISNILDLKVYDTQCGCKWFTRAVALELFKQPFTSKWLFDVELFHRFLMLNGKEAALANMLEVPLKRWIDTDNSKVKMSYMFKLWIDLYRINKICKSERSAVQPRLSD